MRLLRPGLHPRRLPRHAPFSWLVLLAGAFALHASACDINECSEDGDCAAGEICGTSSSRILGKSCFTPVSCDIDTDCPRGRCEDHSEEADNPFEADSSTSLRYCSCGGDCFDGSGGAGGAGGAQ